MPFLEPPRSVILDYCAPLKLVDLRNTNTMVFKKWERPRSLKESRIEHRIGDNVALGPFE